MGAQSPDYTDVGFLTALHKGHDGIIDSSSATRNDITTPAGEDNFPSSSYYLMPWPQRFAWITVFALLVFVAAVGNSLVAWIVFG